MKGPQGGAPPPLVLCMGVVLQAFIDGLVFSIPDGSGAHFWSSGAHLLSNLRRPGAHNGARWNFGRHQGQADLKFFPALATFGVFLGPGRIPKIDRNSISGGRNGPRGDAFSDFCGVSDLFCFFGRFWIDFCRSRPLKSDDPIED